MQARILIIDPSSEQHKTYMLLFSKQHFLAHTYSLSEAKKELEIGFFDLILLDTLLPDGDGLSFFADLQMNEDTREIPVIFVTSQTELNKEIIAFSLGAEDFVTNTIEAPRLRARIDARLKHIKARKDKNQFFMRRDLKVSVNLQKAVILKDGKEYPVELTPVEFKLLFHFLRHEDHVFTRDQLLMIIKGKVSEPLDRTVDMHVSNIRKKITMSDFCIKSIHGTGYRMSYSIKNKSDTKTPYSESTLK